MYVRLGIDLNKAIVNKESGGCETKLPDNCVVRFYENLRRLGIELGNI